MRWIASLFSSNGRLAPTGFWVGFLALSAVGLAALTVPRVGALLWLAMLYPWTCLYARRLHDLGRSGWFQLVAWAVNLALMVIAIVLIGGALVTGFSEPQGMMLALTEIAGTMGGITLTAGLGIFNLVWLVWLGTASGERDANRFGPAPPTADERRLIRARR